MVELLHTWLRAPGCWLIQIDREWVATALRLDQQRLDPTKPHVRTRISLTVKKLRAPEIILFLSVSSVPSCSRLPPVPMCSLKYGPILFHFSSAPRQIRCSCEANHRSATVCCITPSITRRSKKVTHKVDIRSGQGIRLRNLHHFNTAPQCSKRLHYFQPRGHSGCLKLAPDLSNGINVVCLSRDAPSSFSLSVILIELKLRSP